MKIERLIVSLYNTNCYILIKDNNCLIIDPGDNYELISSKISSYNLVGIIITHYHFDHIGALENLKKNYHVNVYDFNNLKNLNQIENFKFKLIRNPGHTPDSITIYFEEDNIMFTGDFIFNSSIGRTDLAGGSEEEMIKSLAMIKKYPDSIIIKPGHGEETTLGKEKNNFILYF